MDPPDPGHRARGHRFLHPPGAGVGESLRTPGTGTGVPFKGTVHLRSVLGTAGTRAGEGGTAGRPRGRSASDAVNRRERARWHGSGAAIDGTGRWSRGRVRSGTGPALPASPSTMAGPGGPRGPGSSRSGRCDRPATHRSGAPIPAAAPTRTDPGTPPPHGGLIPEHPLVGWSVRGVLTLGCRQGAPPALAQSSGRCPARAEGCPTASTPGAFLMSQRVSLTSPRRGRCLGSAGCNSRLGPVPPPRWAAEPSVSVSPAQT